MCFSATQSLGFAAMGLSTVCLLLWRGRSWKYVGLALYFTIMEVLQFLQYMVINDCSSKLNQLLTWLAYVHVSLQPVVFNEFVWGQPQPIFNKNIISKDADHVIHWVVRRLATVASALLILKGAPALLQLLGLTHWAPLHSLLGPALSAYLTSPATTPGGGCCADNPEMLCGQQLCSFYGKFHVGWSVPSLPHSYYIPTAFVHGFFFFVPALALGGPPQIVLGLAAFFTGPVLTEVLLGGDADARRYEWASIWCMFSLGQVLLLLVVELIGSRLLTGTTHLPPVAADNQTGFLTSDLLAPFRSTDSSGAVLGGKQQGKQAANGNNNGAASNAASGAGDIADAESDEGSDGQGVRRSRRLQQRKPAATADAAAGRQ